MYSAAFASLEAGKLPSVTIATTIPPSTREKVNASPDRRSKSNSASHSSHPTRPGSAEPPPPMPRKWTISWQHTGSQTEEKDLLNLQDIQGSVLTARRELGTIHDDLGFMKAFFKEETDIKATSQAQWATERIQFLERHYKSKLESSRRMYLKLEDQIYELSRELEKERSQREIMVQQAAGEVFEVMKRNEVVIEETAMKLQVATGTADRLKEDLDRERLNTRQLERKRNEADKENIKLTTDRDEAKQTVKILTTQNNNLEKDLADVKKASDLNEWRLNEIRNELKDARSTQRNLELDSKKAKEECKLLKRQLEDSNKSYEKAMETIDELNTQLRKTQSSSMDNLAAVAAMKEAHQKQLEEQERLRQRLQEQQTFMTQEDSSPSSPEVAERDIVAGPAELPTEPAMIVPVKAATPPPRKAEWWESEPSARDVKRSGSQASTQNSEMEELRAQVEELQAYVSQLQTEIQQQARELDDQGNKLIDQQLLMESRPETPTNITIDGMDSEQVRALMSQMRAEMKNDRESELDALKSQKDAEQKHLLASLKLAEEQLHQAREQSDRDIAAIQEKLQQQISEYEAQICSLQQLYEEQRTLSIQHEQNESRLQAENKTIMQQLTDKRGENSRVRDELDEVRRQVGDHYNAQSHQTQMIAKLTEELLNYKQDVSLLSSELAITEEQYNKTVQRIKILESTLQISTEQMESLQQNLNFSYQGLEKQYAIGNEQDLALQKVKSEMEEQSRQMLELNLLNGKLNSELEQFKATSGAALIQTKEKLRIVSAENEAYRADMQRAAQTISNLEKAQYDLQLQIQDQATKLAATDALAASRGTSVEELTNTVFELKAFAGDLRSKLQSQQALLDVLQKPRTSQGTDPSLSRKAHDDARRALVQLQNRTYGVLERMRVLKQDPTRFGREVGSPTKAANIDAAHQMVLGMQAAQREVEENLMTMAQIVNHLQAENHAKNMKLQSAEVLKQELTSKNAKIQATSRLLERVRREAQEETMQSNNEIGGLRRQLHKRGELVAKLVARGRVLEQMLVAANDAVRRGGYRGEAGVADEQAASTHHFAFNAGSRPPPARLQSIPTSFSLPLSKTKRVTIHDGAPLEALASSRESPQRVHPSGAQTERTASRGSSSPRISSRIAPQGRLMLGAGREPSPPTVPLGSVAHAILSNKQGAKGKLASKTIFVPINTSVGLSKRLASMPEGFAEYIETKRRPHPPPPSNAPTSSPENITEEERNRMEEVTLRARQEMSVADPHQAAIDDMAERDIHDFSQRRLSVNVEGQRLYQDLLAQQSSVIPRAPEKLFSGTYGPRKRMVSSLVGIPESRGLGLGPHDTGAEGDVIQEVS